MEYVFNAMLGNKMKAWSETEQIPLDRREREMLDGIRYVTIRVEADSESEARVKVKAQIVETEDYGQVTLDELKLINQLKGQRNG